MITIHVNNNEMIAQIKSGEGLDTVRTIAKRTGLPAQRIVEAVLNNSHLGAYAIGSVDLDDAILIFWSESSFPARAVPELFKEVNAWLTVFKLSPDDIDLVVHGGDRGDTSPDILRLVTDLVGG